MQIKLKTCPQKTCPFLECSDPVLKENVRRELIPYSEQLWNLELTPPSNLLSDSKSSVTKSYDISLQCIWSLLWISKYIKKKKIQEFRLEICQPCRLSRSNDFWSGKRNWFHYFQIIRQQLLELNFTENGRKSLSRKLFSAKILIQFLLWISYESSSFKSIVKGRGWGGNSLLVVSLIGSLIVSPQSWKRKEASGKFTHIKN